MTYNSFDIIVITDPRFQGGTGSAVEAEIAAATQAGYRVGFVSYEAINLRQPLPFNPRLRLLVDQDQVTLIVPGTFVNCRLAILHNPYSAGLLPVEPLNITAEKRMVVVHHPPIDANGSSAYDLQLTYRNAEEILSGPADWAPVGPNARATFTLCDNAPRLTTEDWENAIDFDTWRHNPKPRQNERITIGRHSRADLRKFPATRESFVQIYREDPRVSIDLLGCPKELPTLYGPVQPHWNFRLFGAIPVREYIDGLDVFVYYHREDWVEAFGYAVLEAMARGVPCVLPPTLAPSFSDAAKIALPEEAFDAARALSDMPNEARDAGYNLIHERYSFAAVTRRIRNLIGAPAKKMLAAPSSVKSEPGVLLISTNGIGMGHLTRTIAIARRIQAPMKPILVTMSHGAAVAKDFGLHTEFIPYHNYLGVDKRIWNFALRDEIQAMIDSFDARVVVFDGNSPFQGIIDALVTRPQVWSIWSRRGMWRAGSNPEFMEREKYFDAVIEPRDLAGAFDQGPTVRSTSITRRVAPIRLLDKHELLPKTLARAELGLDPEATAILVQLGGGNNYDICFSRDLILSFLGERENVQIVLIGWKISATSTPEKLPNNVIQLSTYPIARYLNAFDATVSAAGYNSFHEVTEAGLPAIYIPNENPSQDDQLARASFAARHGAALVARRDQPERLIEALATVLNPDRRASMARAAQDLSSTNGAVEAAQLIAHLGQTYRGQRA